MSKVFSEKKGWSMDKTNRAVYKDVLRLFGSFLFVALIFCNGSSVCAGVDDSKASNKIDWAWRYVSDGLLIYNELVAEAGSDFVKARKMHADLIDLYVREMEARQRDYAAALLTKEALDILAKLNSIRESLAKPVPEDEKDLNTWAKEDIEQASKRVGELLKNFEPYLKEPFDFDGFEKLGDECRKKLDEALKDVKVKLRAYIKELTTEKTNDLMIKKAEELCEANRRAILLLFLNRFARFEDNGINAETSGEGFDLRAIRQFRGDINRTIYWNKVLQKRLKGTNHASVLEAYSISELRRLRVLRAVMDNDMRETQALLLVAFRDSYPLKNSSGKE